MGRYLCSGCRAVRSGMGLVILAGVVAQAQQPGLEEVIQEFALAPPAYVQGDGEWQFGAGFARQWNDKAESEYELGVEYGVSERVQLMLEAEDSEDEDTSSHAAGVGWRFFQGANSQMVFNIARERDESGDRHRWWTSPGMVFGQRVGHGQVHAHAGAALSQAEEVWLYDVAGLYPFAGVTGTLEFNGVRDGDERVHYVTPGLRFHPAGRKNMEIGVAAPLGISDESADHALHLQLVLSVDG